MLSCFAVRGAGAMAKAIMHYRVIVGALSCRENVIGGNRRVLGGSPEQFSRIHNSDDLRLVWNASDVGYCRKCPRPPDGFRGIEALDC